MRKNKNNPSCIRNVKFINLVKPVYYLNVTKGAELVACQAYPIAIGLSGLSLVPPIKLRACFLPLTAFPKGPKDSYGGYQWQKNYCVMMLILNFLPYQEKKLQWLNRNITHQT